MTVTKVLAANHCDAGAEANYRAWSIIDYIIQCYRTDLGTNKLRSHWQSVPHYRLVVMRSSLLKLKYFSMTTNAIVRLSRFI